MAVLFCIAVTRMKETENPHPAPSPCSQRKIRGQGEIQTNKMLSLTLPTGPGRHTHAQWKQSLNSCENPFWNVTFPVYQPNIPPRNNALKNLDCDLKSIPAKQTLVLLCGQTGLITSNITRTSYNYESPHVLTCFW